MKELPFGFKYGFLKGEYGKRGILVDKSRIEVGDCLDFAIKYVESNEGEIYIGRDKLGLFHEHYVVKNETFVDPSEIFDKISERNFLFEKKVKRQKWRKMVELKYNTPYPYSLYRRNDGKKILTYIIVYPLDLMFGGVLYDDFKVYDVDHSFYPDLSARGWMEEINKIEKDNLEEILRKFKSR